jgi:hypothetical protein
MSQHQSQNISPTLLILGVIAAFLCLTSANEAVAATIKLLPASDRYAADINTDGTFDQLFDENTPDLFVRDNFGIPGEYRSALEFDLSTIPRGATINSAVLSLKNFSLRGGTIVQFHGYAGNGSVELADMSISNFLGERSALSDFTIDILPFIQTQLDNNSSFAGVMVKTSNGGVAGFGSKEAVNSLFQPTLTLDVTLPASFTTFEDKAAFLAATGAVNATGPLPNLGGVANSLNPTGSATVGAITFSLAPGGDNLFIGALGTGIDDWTPLLPGNDIALGFENLQVETQTPVYALGFDFVEPDQTMPPFGGTPVPSTYQITLFNGPDQVGQLNFTVPHPDVAAFVGIQSNTAFDRVWIIDVTDSPFIDDNEYFGEFYTGTAAASSVSLVQRAGLGTVVPGGSATFSAFPLEPVATAGRLAFLGQDTLGQTGLYSCLSGSPCTAVANTSTAVPSGTGSFTGFSDPAVSGNATAFIGAGAGQTGVYACDSSIPGDPCRVRANLNTAIPGGAGNFTEFNGVAVSGTLTVFNGAGAGQAGVYAHNSTIPTDPYRVLADLNTVIPGGTGAFTGFSEVAAAGHLVSFLGAGAGQQGVYLSPVGIPTDPITPADPLKVVDLATPIPGGTGAFTAFSAAALSADRVGFIGAGAGQQGVYVSPVGTPTDPTIPGDPLKVADLATLIPGGTGRFTGFEALSATTGHLAFLGLGDSGQKGIYLASILSKLIAVGDTLDGKTVADLRLGRFALDGNTLSFTARFTDGSEGIYAADVTLLRFPFNGFYQPVDNAPTVNRVQAGQAVPVKFSLGGNQGLDIFAAGYPRSHAVACNGRNPTDAIEQTVATGRSRLIYNAATARYTYAWKTEKAWSNTCRELVLKFKDNRVRRARFRFN